jgi:hypothetical protein
MSSPTIDHRGPDFARLGLEVLAGLKEVFQTKGHVVIFPSSGTGAWEAALTNTLSPGDKILMFESGHFATLWIEMARRLGLDVDVVPTDWRHIAATNTRPFAWCTTRLRPESPAACPQFARPSTAPIIRRYFWWTRSRRWRRSTSDTMSGKWT